MRSIKILQFKSLDTLITCSEGDLRKAITFLQCAAKLKIGGGSIKSTDVLEIAGVSLFV
jgi:DNA polymerase III delta prime subunit